jgi:hypothetical protein
MTTEPDFITQMTWWMAMSMSASALPSTTAGSAVKLKRGRSRFCRRCRRNSGCGRWSTQWPLYGKLLRRIEMSARMVAWAEFASGSGLLLSEVEFKA